MHSAKSFIPALAILLFCCIPLLLSCCGDDTITDPADIVFPDSNVSYGRQVQPFFNLSCTFSGCHDDASQAGGIALTSYNNLFRKPGTVVAGLPESSTLYQVMLGPANQGLPHPYFRTQISQNHLTGIKTWIKEGALYN